MFFFCGLIKENSRTGRATLNHEELPIQTRYFCMIYEEFYSYTLCIHWLHQSMLAEESHISSDPVEKRNVMLFHVIPLQHVNMLACY